MKSCWEGRVGWGGSTAEFVLVSIHCRQMVSHKFPRPLKIGHLDVVRDLYLYPDWDISWCFGFRKEIACLVGTESYLLAYYICCIVQIYCIMKNMRGENKKTREEEYSYQLIWLLQDHKQLLKHCMVVGNRQEICHKFQRGPRILLYSFSLLCKTCPPPPPPSFIFRRKKIAEYIHLW